MVQLLDFVEVLFNDVQAKVSRSATPLEVVWVLILGMDYFILSMDCFFQSYIILELRNGVWVTFIYAIAFVFQGTRFFRYSSKNGAKHNILPPTSM